jgi:hypothetical protein
MFYTLNPLQDPRWGRFVGHHPDASIFHTSEWLQALHQTYGYEPIVFTPSSPDEDLRDAAVFCVVRSWLTGNRLVSLPFSDHCNLLIDKSAWSDFTAELQHELHRRLVLYIEMRPKGLVETQDLQYCSTYSYCLHKIDLTQEVDWLWHNCHKSCTQRKIRRAQREGLSYEEGRSTELLDSFYQLLLLTRRRHMLPPQPKNWFQALIDSFGEKLSIKVAFKQKQPVAAILIVRHQNIAFYKYGCSDSRLHQTGGMQMLMWRSILDAKKEGCHIFDLGRSGWDDTGLIAFKDRLGGHRSELTYLRLYPSEGSKRQIVQLHDDWKMRAGKKIFSHLSDSSLRYMGEFLYKHIG